MNKAIKSKKTNGLNLLIEVNEIDSNTNSQEGSRLLKVGNKKRVTKAINLTKDSLDKITETIIPIGDSVYEKYNKASNMPSTISIEFGIKISLEGKIVIANFTSEANFKISMTWSK